GVMDRGKTCHANDTEASADYHSNWVNWSACAVCSAKSNKGTRGVRSIHHHHSMHHHNGMATSRHALRKCSAGGTKHKPTIRANPSRSPDTLESVIGGSRIKF